MATTDFSGQVGRQQFLNLFVSQLQYQNPLEPAGQEEFLQQLAMFSQVEGTESLNKQVETLNSKFDTLNDNVAQLLTAQLAASGSSQSSSTAPLADTTEITNLIRDMEFAASLIGRKVTYETQYGKEITDKVESVLNGASGVQVQVGNTNVPLRELTEIYGAPNTAE